MNTDLSVMRQDQQQLDVTVTALLTAKPSKWINRQLYLLRPGVLSQYFNRHLGAAPARELPACIEAMPFSEALTLLPTLDKVSVYVRTKGNRAFLDLGLITSSDLAQTELAEVDDFACQVRALTDGVVTVYQLSHYRLLRMMLFAALGRSMNRQSQEPFNRFGNNRNEVITRGQFLDEQYRDLLDIFQQMDLLLALPETLSQLERRMAVNLQNFEGFKSIWQRDDDLQKIITILELLRRAIAKPHLLMPQLQSPVCHEQIAGIFGEDSREIDRRVRGWLDDFVLVWRMLSPRVLAPLKEALIKTQQINTSKSQNAGATPALIRQIQENTTKFQNAKTAAPAIIQQYEDLTKEYMHLFEAIQEFEALPVSDQRQQLEKLTQLMNSCEVLWSKRDQIVRQYERLQLDLNSLIDLCVKKTSGKTQKKELEQSLSVTFNQNYHYPYHYCQALASAVNSGLAHSCRFRLLFFATMEQVLDPRFRPINCVTLVDLLDVQLRHRFWELFSEGGTKDDTPLQHGLNEMQNAFEGLFVQMRRYYVLRRHNLGRDAKDFKYDMKCQKRAADMAKMAETLLQSQATNDPRVITLLQMYGQLGRCLAEALLGEHWPQFFVRSPYASDTPQPVLERGFYFTLFNAVRHSFLDVYLDDLMDIMRPVRKKLELKEEIALYEQLLSQMREVFKFIKEQQKNERQSLPTLDYFEQQARAFENRVTQCAMTVEELVEDANQAISDLPVSIALLHLQAILPTPVHAFQTYVLSTSQPLFHYLDTKELIEEDREARKRPARAVAIQRSSAATAAAAAAAASPASSISSPLPAPRTERAPEPESLEGIFQAFQGEVGQLVHSVHSFIPNSNKKEDLDRQVRMNECANNLLALIPSLRELISTIDTEGESPCFKLAIYLKVSVALEQTAKCLMASLNIEIKRPGPLQQTGHDYGWQSHSPHLFAHEVETHFIQTQRAFLFEIEERKFLQSLKRVIAVSSRYPASGRDRVTEALRGEGDSARTILQMGLQVCRKLWKRALPAGTSAPSDHPLSNQQLEICLARVTDTVSPTKPLVDVIETRIRSLQKYLCYEPNREVPYLSSEDISPFLRQETIRGSLKDLLSSLQLTWELLQAPNDPRLCLVQGEVSLLQQAVMLEKILLLLLSHLPCPGAHAKEHYLWEMSGERPRRYRHDLVGFSDRLASYLKVIGIAPSQALLAETAQQARRLAPLIQLLYRYHRPLSCPAAEQLDKLKNLSLLRQRVNHLTQAEEQMMDPFINVSKDSRRLEKLDEHIIKVLQAEVKQPLYQMLELVNEWLKFYDNLLKSDASYSDTQIHARPYQQNR